MAILAPWLITEGFFHVVTPPYFSLQWGKQKESRLYRRSAEDVLIWLAEHVYYRAIDITLISPLLPAPLLLDRPTFVSLAMLITEIGDCLRNLSEELSINPHVLEGLTHVTHYLTPETMDVNAIMAKTPMERVHYDAARNVLTFTVGMDDHAVALHGLVRRLYQTLTPLMHRVAWLRHGLSVTTKLSNQFVDTRMGLYHIYLLFEELRKPFKFKVYKGVGGMPPAHKFTTCMDPLIRVTHQVRSLGDVNTIFDLLSKKASDPRKQLLTRYTGERV